MRSVPESRVVELAANKQSELGNSPLGELDEQSGGMQSYRF